MDKWIGLRAPPAKPTVGASAARHGDFIFLTGGINVSESTAAFNTDFNTATTLCYSIEKNTWQQCSDMPQALTHDNSSCVAGGAIRSEQHCSSALYAHDIIGKLWLTKARMHLKRYMFCLETVNDLRLWRKIE